ncbi:hypothetical protein [Actinomadura rugatobispora]|uniref:Uncharacterized protein n=1 Tax=Actinomadura rugatobispora TaxID=1994 RepID=A0ABW0ZWL0_9ACTN|nr:hypothetical protein GCM10010200_037940 [Actinomadura rugatobispora]
MRPASYLVGLSVIAAAGLMSAPAHAAAPGLVDGTVSAAGATCSWTNATTSNTPPNTLTINHTTISPTCSGGVTVTLSSSPTVTFNDNPPGTASAAQIDVTANLGITCGYRVTNVTVNRQGTTRTYTGGPYTATKTSGSFLCPGSATVDSATFTFH